jgi:hypothetical protein
MDLGSIYRRSGEGSRQLVSSGKEVGGQRAPAPKAPLFLVRLWLRNCLALAAAPTIHRLLLLTFTKSTLSLTTRSVPQLETEPALRGTQIAEMGTLNCQGPAQLLLNVGFQKAPNAHLLSKHTRSSRPEGKLREKFW